MKRQAQWLLVVAMLLITGCAPIQTYKLEPPIASARTKADHEALAAHYELEAKTLKDRAEAHRQRAKTYGALAHKGAPTFGQHCESLASYYQKAAEENLELARMHRELAAEAQQ